MKGAKDPARPQLALFTPGPTPGPTPGKAGQFAAVDAEFEERFWPAYPRKVGKGDARESYRRAAKKKSWPGVAEVLGRLEAQKETPRWQAGYIPNPATWLNQERWDDDPATMGNGKAQGWRDQPPPAWFSASAERRWWLCGSPDERSLLLDGEIERRR